MYRQSSSRNHRSRGIKLKNILQICLLLAVCSWLMYQVKHSHDKKKEFDESDAKASIQRVSSDEIIRLGRKDIQSRDDGSIAKNENHDDPLDEEETNGEEVEVNKSEEEDPEGKKVEEKEEDGMGGGDDETDEHEQEKSVVEVDKEQDFIDGEAREDGDENESQERDSEDVHGQIEKDSAEDVDHDGDDRSSHEAREEHYKADDASSAVAHDAQIVTTENDNGHVENSHQHDENILEEGNRDGESEEMYVRENSKELEVEGGRVARDDQQSNVTSETMVDVSDNSGNVSSPNITAIEGSNDHSTSNITSEVKMENHDLSSENVTEGKPELNHGQENVTEVIPAERSHLQTVDPERANNSILNVENAGLDSDSTGSSVTTEAESRPKEFSDSSNNSTATSASENTTISEASLQAGNNTASSEKNNEIEVEKSDTSDGTDENMETSLSENPEEVQQDVVDESDTSDSVDEKDVRTDLETLPEILTEGTNNDDAAAE